MLCEREGCGRTVPARPARRAAFAGLCKHCRHNAYVRVRNGLSADLDTASAWLRANAALPTIRPWPPGWIACRRSGCPSGTAPPREAGYPPKPELVGFCAPCRTHAWQRVQSGRSASTRDAAQWLDTHPKRPQRHARAPQTTPASASETRPPARGPVAPRVWPFCAALSSRVRRAPGLVSHPPAKPEHRTPANAPLPNRPLDTRRTHEC